MFPRRDLFASSTYELPPPGAGSPKGATIDVGASRLEEKSAVGNEGGLTVNVNEKLSNVGGLALDWRYISADDFLQLEAGLRCRGAQHYQREHGVQYKLSYRSWSFL